MSYFIPEDVGPTARVLRMTPNRVLRVWESTKGICVNCGKPIDGARDKWFCEHIIALENGGKDDEKNMGPAHWGCKATKDAEDHARAAKARDVKKLHLGIKDAKRRKIPQPPRAPKHPGKPLPPRRPIYGMRIMRITLLLLGLALASCAPGQPLNPEPFQSYRWR